jgi:predicted nucleotidyltransferase
MSIGRVSLIWRVWLHWKKFVANTIGGNSVLNQDFKEFIQSLNDNNVRYLVVGGYAVAFHGHPRYTKDIDIWIQVSDENATNLVKAIEEFGFGSLGLKKEDFLVPDQIVQLGYAPNRIDLIAQADGVDFNECYAAHLEVEIDGVRVNFIDLENLKKNKKASGRLQDLADIEKLQ